jgi:hypothetical protein
MYIHTYVTIVAILNNGFAASPNKKNAGQNGAVV